ncbi:MAG: methyltransferase domain-containing protein [archaeon]
MGFFKKIYSSWKPVQEEKYEQISELLKEKLKEAKSMIDYGIGHGWFEEHLEKKKLLPERVVGVEVDKEIEKKDYVKYIFTKKLNEEETKEHGKHDLVVAIDSFHLINDFSRLEAAAKEGGLIVIALPKSKAYLLEKINKKPLFRGEIGSREKDILVIYRK